MDCPPAGIAATLVPVIEDVDDSMRALVRAAGVATSVGVEIATPDQAWVEALSAPAVNLWLHAIDEDTAARNADWEDVVDDRGRLQGRRPPLRRYRLSYLVSAWAKTAEAEHRLLSQLLLGFASHDVVPVDLLAGALARQERSVMLTVALPRPGRETPWGLWTALGVQPRPALDVVLTAPLERQSPEAVGPPVQSRQVSAGRTGGTPEIVPTTVRDAAIRARLEATRGATVSDPH